MRELRNKTVQGIWCKKCKITNSQFIKCMCQLKEPKEFPCKREDEFALYWCYTLLIWWKSDGNDHRRDAEDISNQRREDIEVIADIDIEHNPFIYCVYTPQGSYYNLARAEKIQIIGPNWYKIHKTKHGNAWDHCYCDGNVNLPEPKDFKD